MRDAMFLGLIIVLSIFLGAISNEFGVTQPTIITPNSDGQFEPDTPNDPSEESGGIFDKILAPFSWTFNAITSFFKIITFQVDAIPPLLSAMILLPLSISTLWLIIRLIRGGG